MEYFALATSDEFRRDPELDFEFARERMRGINLAEIFYKKLMETQDREVFVGGFETILSRATSGILKALDEIYPRPNPTIKQVVDKMNYSVGSLMALEQLLGAFNSTNAQLDVDKQFKPEHLEVLLRVAYGHTGMELSNIQNALVQLSERAKANNLFISLD